MIAVQEVVRKHMEAMHDELAVLIAEDNERDWAERRWEDGRDFGRDMVDQIAAHMMTRAEYMDWYEDLRTRGPL